VLLRSSSLLLAMTLFVLAQAASALVAIDWVTVGNPGNPCDPQTAGCFGSVAEPYQIGKYEVTNRQYAEFLNAVAATDTHALYNTNMATAGNPSFGGITRTGSSGSFTYSAIVGREEMAVNWVSFWDATRFANWLHNGQPVGAQDGTTTEDGAYTLTPAGIAGNTVTRNVGAEKFIPNEDQWYKAAYYNPGSVNDPNAIVYFEYPAGFNAQVTCMAPPGIANSANCANAAGDLTDVGSYVNSSSPNGTFDQAGNVSEVTDVIIVASVPSRVLRGNGWFASFGHTASATARFPADVTAERSYHGFRVGSTIAAPPAVLSTSPVGATALIGLLGLSCCWSLRVWARVTSSIAFER